MNEHASERILEHWNGLPAEAAAAMILPCNGSHAWAVRLAAARPFAAPEQLFQAADEAWWTLTEADWQQAFDSHPRIGERHAPSATKQGLAWSKGEQSAATTDEQTRATLAQANLEYEQAFGRVFLVCASGKSATQILTILQRRLHNDPATELREAAEQQCRITQLRLRKWLESTGEI